MVVVLPWLFFKSFQRAWIIKLCCSTFPHNLTPSSCVVVPTFHEMFLDVLAKPALSWAVGDKISSWLLLEAHFIIASMMKKACFNVANFCCDKYSCWFFFILLRHSLWDNPWSSARDVLARLLQRRFWAWHASWSSNFPSVRLRTITAQGLSSKATCRPTKS